MKEIFINAAIKESCKSKRTLDFPVGCVIVYNDKIIAKAHNKRNYSKKTIDHAEIIAINKANKIVKDWRLYNCDMYVTLIPCEMCKNVIKEARINNVYYLYDKDENRNLYTKTKFKKIDIKHIDNNSKTKIENYLTDIKQFFSFKR